MKAIIFDAPGDAEVLRYADAPDPEPSDGELLVRVRASAVNRADILQRRGGYAPPPGASPILGLELAGEVVQPAGAWQAGDRVMAVVTGGGYAELAAVPAGMAIRIPEQFSFAEAAAIPEAFLTAYLNLFTLGRLQAGETALVHAGASGVGTSVQMAPCCRPIPGDAIVGYLGRGEGLVVHTADCAVGRRLHERDREHWMSVEWAEEMTRPFETAISVLLHNGKGVLAQVASAVSAAEADIIYIDMGEERAGDTTDMRLVLSVRDRVHLAEAMRLLKRTPPVQRVARVKP